MTGAVGAEDHSEAEVELGHCRWEQRNAEATAAQRGSAYAV